MKHNKIIRFAGVWMILAFVLWTAALCRIDVQAIGPLGSPVGFATLNRWVHQLTGVHMTLYVLTDWLSLVPVAFVFGFALLGLRQWITRKHLSNVDRSILILGGYYLLVMSIYLLFEVIPINYRPILMDGVLEVSYPSSTTLLTLCVMPTAIFQLRSRIGHSTCKKWLTLVLAAFTGFMVIARFLSGVHWFSDILGGMFLSTGLVLLYRSITD